MTVDELFPPLDIPPAEPLSVWCPACGAYLMTLGLPGPWECEMCGAGIEEVAE